MPTHESGMRICTRYACMRCGQSLQKRCMPGVGRSKIQPGRPRIREVLGRSVAPVATQPDDKCAGGRVEGRNGAAFIGRDGSAHDTHTHKRKM